MKSIKRKTRQKTNDWRFGISIEKFGAWMNIAGFIVGILFYFRIESKFNQPSVIFDHSSYDSLLINDTKLKFEVKQLKITQDSLIRQILHQKKFLSVNGQKKFQLRQQISKSLQTDWDALSTKQKEEYVNKTMSNLKQKANEEVP